MRIRRLLGIFLLIVCVSVAVQGRSYMFVQAATNLAFFTNETGMEATSLIIVFSKNVEILSVIGFGAEMAVSSSQGPTVILSGVVSPYGVVQIEWVLGEGSVEAAVWRSAPLAIHSIDVKSPIARISIISGDEENELLFLALGSSDPNGTIVKYLWEWSDDITAGGPNTSRIFAPDVTTRYSVTLTVTNDTGLSDSIRMFFTIEVEEELPWMS